MCDEITEEDFDQKNARSFAWTADNKLRRFQITRNDGTVKHILFSDILADRKLRKLIEKRIQEAPIDTSFDSTYWYDTVVLAKKILMERIS